MPAHRKPSVLLERAGAFRKNPSRRRKDIPGKGELPKTPPARLRRQRGAVAAWKEIVEAIPDGVATGSDRFVVERAAVLLAQSWEFDRFTAAQETQLRAYLGSLGLGPEARARIGGRRGGEKSDNPFGSVGEPVRPPTPMRPRRDA